MEIQKEVIDRILKNDFTGVKDLLSRHNLKPETYDEHGMTLLQHASYKGNKEMVQLLLDQGADVNSTKHDYGYTALHFAALSGSVDVCQLLLEYGAKTYATNSVGRTPSQMAAFVGNHTCVTTINNFVPKSDIDYYTVTSGFEVEPKLPALVSGPLHKFVMEVNLDPRKIAINVLKFPLLLENIEKVKNVLELMSEREIKRGLETNEIMSFKYHYLSQILEKIIKCKKDMENSESSHKKTPKDAVVWFIKPLLACSDASCLNHLLREITTRFHYKESTIFRQIARGLNEAISASQSALSVITSIINGQRGFIDSEVESCATCGEEKASKKCSQCKVVQYCDKECQKIHWFMHKKVCSKAKNSDATSEIENSKAAFQQATETLALEIKDLKTT